jgi:site-specific recombinase XerD
MVDKPIAPTPPETAAKPAETRITKDDAIKVFLSNREGAKVAPATLRKYKTFAKQLREYGDTRGYVMLDQFTSSDMDVFYSGLKLGVRAKAKRLSTLRAFFRFSVNRKWITENPVSSD